MSAEHTRGHTLRPFARLKSQMDEADYLEDYDRDNDVGVMDVNENDSEIQSERAEDIGSHSEDESDENNAAADSQTWKWWRYELLDKPNLYGQRQTLNYQMEMIWLF